jgi:hypothetical protein
MTNSLPKVELKLNEENELSFRLSIEGSDALDSKPVFRFVMTEADSDRGWVFPGKSEGDDLVNVRIPSLKETFSPTKKYFGKLEVIVGSHYFNPTEVMVEFNTPLSVSAIPVTNSPKKKSPKKVVKEEILDEGSEDYEEIQATPEEDETVLFDLDSVISADTPPEAPKSFPKSSRSLTADEAQAFGKVAFTEPPHASPEVQTASPAVDPEKMLPSAQNKKELAERTKMKNHLKNQMKKALLSEKTKEPAPTSSAPAHTGQNLKNLMKSLED